MTGSYRPYEPDQVMLLPAAPQDWLPAGHRISAAQTPSCLTRLQYMLGRAIDSQCQAAQRAFAPLPCEQPIAQVKQHRKANAQRAEHPFELRGVSLQGAGHLIHSAQRRCALLRYCLKRQ